MSDSDACSDLEFQRLEPPRYEEIVVLNASQALQQEHHWRKCPDGVVLTTGTQKAWATFNFTGGPMHFRIPRYITISEYRVQHRGLGVEAILAGLR